jgi:hypothetical protein
MISRESVYPLRSSLASRDFAPIGMLTVSDALIGDVDHQIAKTCILNNRCVKNMNLLEPFPLGFAATTLHSYTQVSQGIYKISAQRFRQTPRIQD